jgi:hypothetical protein
VYGRTQKRRRGKKKQKKMPPRTKKGRAQARGERKIVQRDRTPGIRDYGLVKTLRAVGRALGISKVSKYVEGLPRSLEEGTSFDARLIVHNDASGDWNAFALVSDMSPFTDAKAEQWRYHGTAGGDRVVVRHISTMRLSGHVSIYALNEASHGTESGSSGEGGWGEERGSKTETKSSDSCGNVHGPEIYTAEVVPRADATSWVFASCVRMDERLVIDGRKKKGFLGPQLSLATFLDQLATWLEAQAPPNRIHFISAELKPASFDALETFVTWYKGATEHTRAEMAAAVTHLYLHPHAALERDMRRAGLVPCVAFYGFVPVSDRIAATNPDYHLQERRVYSHPHATSQPAIYWCRDARLGAQIKHMRDTLRKQYPTLGNVTALVDLIGSMICTSD